MQRAQVRMLVVLASIALGVWLLVTLISRPSTEDATDDAKARLAEEAPPTLVGAPGSREAPPDAPAPNEEAEGVWIIGRMLDEDGSSPVAGILVRARASGRDAGQATTEENGRFRIAFGRRPPYQVNVALSASTSTSTSTSTSNGRGATALAQVAPVGPRTVDVGTLRLRALTTLVIRTMSEGKPVAGARVFASSVPHALRPPRIGRSGPDRPGAGFAHRATSDASGRALFEDLPVGAVHLLAYADGPLRSELLVSTAAKAGVLDLELLPARDLRVEVVWEKDGVPIPGCVLVARSSEGIPEREPQPRPITDAAGVAIVPGLPNDTAFEIVVIHPNWCSAYMRGLADKAEPGATDLRIEIPDPTTLRFPIRVEDGPHPPDGTRAALVQSNWAFWPGTRLGLAPFGVIEGSELVVDLHHMFHERATAVLPDGRTGRFLLATDDDQEAKRSAPRLPLEPVVFRDPRSVHVKVRERKTGRPAAGIAVRVFFKNGQSDEISPRTDESGEARIEALPAVQGWVCVCANPELVKDSRQGVFSQRQEVDLTEGDARLEFEVEPVQEGVLELTTEGRRTLPPGLAAELWLLPEGVTWRTPEALIVDLEQAHVRFRLRPPTTKPRPPAVLRHQGAAIILRLTSDTHATEYVRLEAGQPLRAAVDLLPAGSLVTRVVKPDDMRTRIRLETLSDGGTWTAAWEGPVEPFPGETEGGELYVALRPGRYRLHAERLRWSSDEVEVRAGPEPAQLVWDLTPKKFAEGEVVLPAGVDPKGLRIFVLEAEGPPRIVSSTSDLDGTHFRVQIPGDRPVMLKPIHPECQPDEEEGTVTISKAERNLLLRMVPRAR